MSTEAEQISEFMGWMHSEHPDWLALSAEFQTTLDDNSFPDEFPNFTEYAEFIGNHIFMEFIRQRAALPSLEIGHYDIKRNTNEYWPETWGHSGFQDPLIKELIDRVLKFYGLYSSLPLMYLMLQHFVKRLDMDFTLDLGVQRNRLLSQIRELLPDAMIGILDQLSDNTTEMFYRVDCHDGTFFRTNFDNYEFFKNAVRYPPEFNRRKKFLTEDRRGRMLRIFEFVHWFERSKMDEATRVKQSCNLIADVFKDVRSSSSYLEFLESKSAFAEKLYNEYLLEIGEAEN